MDTETTSVWPRWAEIVGISAAWNDHEGWYLPLRALPGENHLDAQPTLDALRPILENPSIEKVGQNLKYDMIVLRAAGVALAGLSFDTMVASYLLDAGQRNHNINDLAKRYLNHATIKIAELIGSGKHQKRMDEVPVEQVAEYAAEDAWLPLRLQPILAMRLAEDKLTDLLANVELPLVEVLAEMEFNGIRVDTARLAELSRRYGERMKEIEEEIYQLAGYRFNIASPKQMQHLLFVELKLPAGKRTKTGASTDIDVLESLAPQHPLPAKIVEYRQYAKLKGTYVDALPEWSIRRREGSTRPSTRWWRPRGDSVRATRTCKTFPSARRRGGKSARPSCRARKAGCCWRRIIRKLNCEYWRISPKMRSYVGHSSGTRTSTPGSPAR